MTERAYYSGTGDTLGKRFKKVPAGASTPIICGVVKVKGSADPQSLDLALLSFVHYPNEGTVRDSSRFGDIPHAIVGVLPSRGRDPPLLTPPR